MALTKFDPWQALRDPENRAKRAHCANPDLPMGTFRTFRTVPRSSICDFEERAAIVEMDGGLSRVDAEHAAAYDAGYGSGMELRAAAVSSWRRLLDQSSSGAARRKSLLADARALVDSPWIGQLVALGWDEVSLFGCGAFEDQVIGLVTSVRDGRIVAVTADSVRFKDTLGAVRTHHRFTSWADEVCLIWEFDAMSEQS